MISKKIEFSVGIFVLVGIIFLCYLSINVGEVEFKTGKHYNLYAKFASVSGLKKGADVELAGVSIGKVDNINLNKEDLIAIVKINIEKDIQVPEDSTLSVKTSGLIGDKFLKLSPGASENILKNNNYILETESSLDIEELVSKYVFGNVD